MKKDQRKWERKQFEKHQRHNTHFASAGVHDFVIILDHLKAGYNIGKIFRSADAFGAREIHLIGTSFFSLQTAKGAFKHVPAFFHQSFESCYQQLAEQGYVFFSSTRMQLPSWVKPPFLPAVRLSSVMKALA